VATDEIASGKTEITLNRKTKIDRIDAMQNRNKGSLDRLFAALGEKTAGHVKL
jgi:hypothetical protein